MIRFRQIKDFAQKANAVDNLDALHQLMDDTVHALGFSYYALGLHVSVASSNRLQISTYPREWIEVFFNSRYIDVDPIAAACQTTAMGFRWSEVERLIKLSPAQREILERSRLAGLGDGFTVPIHIPGECTGSCSFALGTRSPFKPTLIPVLHYVGGFGFEAARRLLNQTDGRGVEDAAKRLTTRQLDCVVLAAQGKSDWHSAQLLGISKQTVHQHIETAKRKYGVSTRTQLVLRVLFDNQVGFQDVIGR